MSLAGRGGDESRPDSCSPVPLSTEWCSWPHGAVLSTRATPRRQPDLSDGHPTETCQSHSTVTGFPVFLLCTSDYQPLEVRPPVSTCRDGEDRRPRCLSYKQWNSSGRALWLLSKGQQGKASPTVKTDHSLGKGGACQAFLQSCQKNTLVRPQTSPAHVAEFLFDSLSNVYPQNGEQDFECKAPEGEAKGLPNRHEKKPTLVLVVKESGCLLQTV